MKEIINILKKDGLLSSKGPNTSVIKSLSVSKIADIAIKIENKIRKSYQPAKSPISSHSASLNLGGGRIECANIECRVSRIKKLARFSSLYSDEVYINSFFSDYKDPDLWEDIETTQQFLFDDLLIVHEILPLIEQGFIKFFSPRTNVCFSCQAKQFISRSASGNFDAYYKKLKREYLNNLNVTCELDDDEYLFLLDGPEPYLDHPHYWIRYDAPHPIIKRHTILDKINQGIQVDISKTLIKELDFHTELAHDVATNVIFGLATSGALHTSFLTENDIHVTFLNALQGAQRIREKNLIALNHLSSIVPFAEDVPIKDVLILRKREKEAFISFRNAFNEAIDEFRRSGDSFDEHDAKELYADVINPKLVNLDKKIKAAKKDLIKKPFRSLTSIVGVISFGLLTGIIPPDIAAIAKAIGLVKFGSDTIQQTMALGDSENKIKSDNFYFLWKIREKTK